MKSRCEYGVSGGAHAEIITTAGESRSWRIWQSRSRPLAPCIITSVSTRLISGDDCSTATPADAECAVATL